MVFRRNKTDVRPTPVMPNPQRDEQLIDELLNKNALFNGKQQPETQKRKSYVDRKLSEATDELQKMKSEMSDLELDIQERLNEAKILAEIRDGKAGMYIVDILDVLDDFRGKEFDTEDDVLNAIEQIVIQTTIRDTREKATKR